MWKMIQERLGYSSEDLAKFKDNPRNLDVLEKSPAIMSHSIVAKVVKSHGCASGHREGDEIRFDGAGNLLSKHNPSRVCIYALYSLTPLIMSATELFYAGADPNEMRFNRCACQDVGLECDGWGQVVLEVTMEERK